MSNTILKKSLLLSLSLVLFYFKLPLFPYAPFLTLELSLEPIILSGYLFSYRTSIYLLLFRFVLVNFFQGFNLVNLVGNISDFCFGVAILSFYFIFKDKKYQRIYNVLLTTIILIILNYYIFFPVYQKILNYKLSYVLILTAILPFNLIKSSLLLSIFKFLTKKQYF